MNKIPHPMTSNFLLNSGYYTKVNFQQMMTQLNNIDENTPYITGFKYMPSFHVNNKDIPEVIRPIKITGTHSYRNNPVIIYFNDKGERSEVEEALWSNDAKSKDGIYILSPELRKRRYEESLIMKGAIDKKSSLSKLPTDMINTILSNNNKLYVKKQLNPYIEKKQSDRKPLGTLDENIVRQGGKKSKKLRRKRKTKKNRRIKKTKRNRRRTGR